MEKKQTPMMKHIIDLQKAKQILVEAGENYLAIAVDSCIDNANIYLAEEEQNCADAFNEGVLAEIEKQAATLNPDDTLNTISD